MPRTVTVQFSDGKVRIYNNVPDDVTPDQVEERAVQENPDRPIARIVAGNLINQELRNAIASRQTTVEDLQAIADRYGGQIQPEDLDTYQQWIDFAADHPDVAIPENIHAAPISRTEATTLGFFEGAGGVVENAAQLFRNYPWLYTVAPHMLLERLPFTSSSAEQMQAFRQLPSYRQAQEQRPNYFTGGRIGGEIAVTAPLIATGGGAVAEAGTALRGLQGANMLARSARAVAPVVENIGRATATGGTGVRAATPEAIAAGAPVATTMARRVGLRATGGALNAALTNLMANRDVTAADLATGAAVPILAHIGRVGAGATYDILARRVGETRAAEIFRNLVAEKGPQIMEALRTAPANARANTAEFLASRGLLTPELAAATRGVAASAEGRPLQAIAEARAAGQTEMRNMLRGGETGTEAVANVQTMRQNVRDTTAAERDEALTRADVGRTQIIPLENAAARDEALANEITNSEFVRRMRALEGRASEQARIMGDYPEFFPDMERIQQTRGIAGAAGQRADNAIEAQIALRDNAAAARRAAENLRAQGLSPLDIGSVVGRLRQAAQTAQYVNPARYRALSSFADNLENRARMMGGVIDAGGLYELRKGMNDQIADLLQGTDPSALQRRTAEIVGDIKPLIDDAIEAAGGTGWRDYLNRFSEGMTRVERQEFGRRLAALPRARFERVMSGMDPDFVTDFFGPGRYDINAEVLPEALPSARRLAGEIGVDRQIAKLGLQDLPSELAGPVLAGVRERVGEAMAPGLSPHSRAFFNVTGRIPGISGGGIAAEQLAREFSQRMTRNAMRNLAPALADPAAAARLADIYSANAMTQAGLDRLTAGGRGAISQSLQQMMNPPEMEGAPATPQQVFLGFEVGPDGQQYPVFGPAGGR